MRNGLTQWTNTYKFDQHPITRQSIVTVLEIPSTITAAAYGGHIHRASTEAKNVKTKTVKTNLQVKYLVFYQCGHFFLLTRNKEINL